jgi:hypothetical protein
MKIGLLMIPDPLIRCRLVDENERGTFSDHFIGYYKLI